MVEPDAVELHDSGTGAGHGHAVPGTDPTGSRSDFSQRGKIGGPDLVQSGAPVVPVLRRQRGSDFHAGSCRHTPRMGSGAGGLPGHVRDSPLVQSLLREGGRNAASRSAGTRGRSGGLTTASYLTLEKWPRHKAVGHFSFLRRVGKIKA